MAEETPKSGGQQQQQKTGQYICETCRRSFNSETEKLEHEKTHKSQQAGGQAAGQQKR